MRALICTRVTWCPVLWCCGLIYVLHRVNFIASGDIKTSELWRLPRRSPPAQHFEDDPDRLLEQLRKGASPTTCQST